MMQPIGRIFFTASCLVFFLSKSMRIISRVTIIALSLAHHASPAARLKELISLEGVRDNQLLGYGLVVGLAGTGDGRQTVFPVQSLTNLLERMGVTVSASALTVKNTAAVLITATLPPYAQPGTKLDVTVAAVGDAKTLNESARWKRRGLRRSARPGSHGWIHRRPRRSGHHRKPSHRGPHP